MIDYFYQAYDATMENEGRGKRTKNKLDPGGESYSGISRVHHPKWGGWPLIDRWIREGQPIDVDRLEPMVREFYREKFWHPIAGDRLAELSPAIAMKVFDTGVNVGAERASEWLQLALNLLNRNQKLYPDLLPDGDIGSKTLGTLRIAMAQRPPTKEVTERRILKVISSRYSDLWFDRMVKFPEREEFRGIWDRV
jgi:lysozyme family protein